jgi:hypothetical protein
MNMEIGNAVLILGIHNSKLLCSAQWNSPQAQRYPRHTVTSWTTSSSVSSGGGEGGRGWRGGVEGVGGLEGGCMPGLTAQISGLFQKHFSKVCFPN